MIKDVPYFKSRQIKSINSLTNRELNKFMLRDALTFNVLDPNKISVLVRRSKSQDLLIEDIVCELPRDKMGRRTFLIREYLGENYVSYRYGFYDKGVLYSDSQIVLLTNPE